MQTRTEALPTNEDKRRRADSFFNLCVRHKETEMEGVREEQDKRMRRRGGHEVGFCLAWNDLKTPMVRQLEHIFKVQFKKLS